MFCQYKDIFGKPKTGVHSFRFFNMAIVDVLATLLGSYLIHKYFNFNYMLTVIILFILSIYLHWLFCVQTTITNFLFKKIE
jgi:hypothetical protein